MLLLEDYVSVGGGGKGTAVSRANQPLRNADERGEQQDLNAPPNPTEPSAFFCVPPRPILLSVYWFSR
jgi:hypothetical protein